MADVRLTATNPEDSSVVPVACDASGRLLLQELPPPFDGTLDGDLTVSGQATFGESAAIIGSDGSAQFAGGTHDFYVNGKVELADSHFMLEPYGLLRVFRDVNSEYPCISWGPELQDRNKGALYPDGSVTFAGNKAGFTAEGYLWCTTRRGDTVILDATANGLGSWAEYTPTVRSQESE